MKGVDMSSKNKSLEKDWIIAEARREQAEREKGYREKALKLFPWICARCGREFKGKKLRELTVHHKDHNHDNHPANGSNWELLCIYCHDNEHSKYLDADWYSDSTPGGDHEPRLSKIYNIIILMG